MNRITYLLIFLFLYSFGTAQRYTTKMAPKPLKENVFTCSDVIGELGNNLLLANMSPGDYSPEAAKMEFSRLELALYDKTSFNLVKRLPLKWALGKSMHQSLKMANCKNVFILNNQVYVIWQSYASKRLSLLVQILDANLREVKAPVTCYEFPVDFFTFNAASLFGKLSSGNRVIVLGGEESADKKENVRIQYKVYDEQMKVLQTVQAELPFYKKSRNSGSAASYLPDDNGDLYYVTHVVNKSKEKAFLVGKISAETSASGEIYIPTDKVKIYDLRIIHSGPILKGFALTSKGLATFSIDKQNFSLLGEILTSELDYARVKFTDYNPTFSKRNVDEYTIKRILNDNLRISNIRELPGGRFIMTANNMQYYQVCNRGGCTPYTSMDGQHYIMVAADGSLDWISCTKQKFNKRTFYRSDNEVAVYGNTMYTSTFGSQVLHSVDLETGKVTIRPVDKKYKYRIIDVENDHLYYTEYRSRKSAVAYALTAGALGAGVAAAALTGEYFIIAGGVLGSTAIYGFSRTISHIYPGEILISK